MDVCCLHVVLTSPQGAEMVIGCRGAHDALMGRNDTISASAAGSVLLPLNCLILLRGKNETEFRMPTARLCLDHFSNNSPDPRWFARCCCIIAYSCKCGG